MLKRALLPAAALFGFCLSLSAQTSSSAGASRLDLNGTRWQEMVTGRPALGEPGSFRDLQSAWSGNGPLTLLDRRIFSFPGAFGWVEATSAALPIFAARDLPRGAAPVATANARVTNDEKFELLPRPNYVGGEVGVFYGTTLGGKFSREVESGYILGEIVEGNTHIQVGAFYGRSSGNAPRVIGR